MYSFVTTKFEETINISAITTNHTSYYFKELLIILCYYYNHECSSSAIDVAKIMNTKHNNSMSFLYERCKYSKIRIL